MHNSCVMHEVHALLLIFKKFVIFFISKIKIRKIKQSLLFHICFPFLFWRTKLAWAGAGVAQISLKTTRVWDILSNSTQIFKYLKYLKTLTMVVSPPVMAPLFFINYCSQVFISIELKIISLDLGFVNFSTCFVQGNRAICAAEL